MNVQAFRCLWEQLSDLDSAHFALTRIRAKEVQKLCSLQSALTPFYFGNLMDPDSCCLAAVVCFEICQSDSVFKLFGHPGF